MTRLPDFLIIGAMKAATSSLHDQLAALDGVFMSTPKELYFFSDDPVFAKGRDWYAHHFDHARADDLCGESSTHYTKLPVYPHTVERIREAIPDARFIYVMRHPIDRLVSQYTHMWLERELSVSFDEAVDGAVPELVDYSLYTTQLRPYFEAFGAERVLPVFFDRMTTEPDDVIQRVVDHVGLDAKVRWNHDLGANNVTAERLQQSASRDRVKALPGYGLARRLVPEATIERIRDRWRPSGRPELSDDRRARLTDRFDADLAELGGWLGTSLDVDSFSAVTASRSFTWQPDVLRRFPTRSSVD